MKQVQEEAIRALSSVQKSGHRNVNLDLISMALHGKKAGFEKIVKLIDDMVVTLKKEQDDDDSKKEYCLSEFDTNEDKKKETERAIADLGTKIAETEEAISTLADEIKALQEGIFDLDKQVIKATEQRKEENAEYTDLMASNTAATEIIGIAKNRMQKFYNPKLYKPPPKRELTEEERITLNMGGTLAPTNPPGGIAGTGIGFEQTGSGSIAAPPPPPEAGIGEYKKKGEEFGGVIQMMDNLKADLQKEITEMEVTEQNAQEDYETMVKDAADTRAADSLSIEEKETAKAGVEADLVKAGDAKAGAEDELMATKEYIADLHAECDWLMSNYDTRKEARAAEIDALKKAKAVLSGADYSLVQMHHSRH